MSALAQALLADLDDQTLDQLAKLLAPRLASQRHEPDPWLNAKQASEHLACTTGRIYDLVQLDKLKHANDGRRLLFRRSDLDAYLEASQ